MNSEEKAKIKKVIDNIYAIDKSWSDHCIKSIDGTYEVVVDDEEYERSASEALYDIMEEIEKIVDIIH